MPFRKGTRTAVRHSVRGLLFACAPAMLLLTCHAQDPLARYPQNYQLLFENEQVSVIHVHYGAHERVPVHDHSDYPTLFVYLNDSGPVRFRIKGVPPSTMVRPAVSLGSFRYSPGRVERHSVESLSEQSSDFLRIELRQFPLQGGEADRHGPPASLNANVDEKEFSNDQVEVERLICVSGQPCPSAASADASLIVAFNDLRLESSGENLSAGSVRWIGPGEGLKVAALRSTAAHLLRILIRAPRTRTPVS